MIIAHKIGHALARVPDLKQVTFLQNRFNTTREGSGVTLPHITSWLHQTMKDSVLISRHINVSASLDHIGRVRTKFADRPTWSWQLLDNIVQYAIAVWDCENRQGEIDTKTEKCLREMEWVEREAVKYQRGPYRYYASGVPKYQDEDENIPADLLEVSPIQDGT